MPTLSSLLPTISFFFLFNLLPSILCGDDYRFMNCYQEFGCGPFNNISYPFWSSDQPEYCGRTGFQLQCEYEDKVGIPTIQIMSQQYRVVEIKPESQTLIIARNDTWKGNCVTGFYDHNTFLDHTVFNLSDSANQNLTLFYDCPPFLPFTDKFQCEIFHKLSDAWISSDAHLIDMNRELLNKCKYEIGVPVLRTGLSLVFNPKEQKIEDVLKVGFEVKYSVNVSICEGCEKSGGRCGFNRATQEFTCFCRDGPNQLRCKAILTPTAFVATVHGSKKMKNVIIGVGAGAGVLLLACVFFLIRLRRKKHQSKSSALISRSLTPDSSIKPDLERGTSSYFQTPIFSYAELQEATDNFDSSKEIGDGGFGTVYHGTLRDGRVVAVKRLYENNYKRHDQFMNELEILSRLRHRNLVTLYGCTTRHSRELLLVYEYIPNGTVADNLHGDRASTSPLTWPVRLSVAIETADALSYLHASDIIHRDVKTTNILLDHNFHVKVADFGLSRLFPMNATHVSTAPQGTPGYVDPEYYQCYQLNDKSDVYSFGVVLIELISSKPAVDIGRHRHEINLSNMAINKIHNDALHELVDPSLGFESDYSVRRMITMVAELAFRCLQQEKDMRPCMMEVLKCLKDIESAEKVEKAEEVDIPADARLLKNVPPFSPTSVTDKWVSSTTTPNTSG